MNLSINKSFTPKYLFIFLFLFLFTACDMTYEFKSVEEENFVGTWTNPNARIVISPKGTFAYELEEPGKKVSINTVIKRIESDKVVLNMFVTESVFDLNTKPFKNANGVWEMTLDDRNYTRSEY